MAFPTLDLKQRTDSTRPLDLSALWNEAAVCARRAQRSLQIDERLSRVLPDFHALVLGALDELLELAEALLTAAKVPPIDELEGSFGSLSLFVHQRVLSLPSDLQREFAATLAEVERLQGRLGQALSVQRLVDERIASGSLRLPSSSAQGS